MAQRSCLCSAPIEVVCSGDGEKGIAIEVTDHGDGIPSQDQERIFHEFVQLGKTQLQDGTGLGLPISRRLAELLHGTLTVTSKQGDGSTFRLWLPAEIDVRSAPVEQDVTADPVVDEPPVDAASADAVRPGLAAGSFEGPPAKPTRAPDRGRLAHS